MRKPKYRRHTVRDLGFVEHEGKRLYLPGPYRSEESVEAYRAFLRSIGFTVPGGGIAPQHVLLELLVSRFMKWADAVYPEGSRSEASNCHAATKLLTELFIEVPVSQITPLRLKEFQVWLAAKKLSRGYINATVSRVKRMFKWGVSEELIPPSIYHALITVPGLRRGRTPAVEMKKKVPVLWADVEATLPHLSPTVQAMVRLQWHTGARPQSICRARPDQFDMSKSPWEWRPRHKTEYMGHELIVFVGPLAQATVEPFVKNRLPKDYLFQPLHLNGKRAKGFRSFYDPVSYLRAVTRGIERANRERREHGLPEIAPWTPHQLRHARATLVREKYGIEAAQAALGHARLDTTQIYAQSQMMKAKLAAEEMG